MSNIKTIIRNRKAERHHDSEILTCNPSNHILDDSIHHIAIRIQGNPTVKNGESDSSEYMNLGHQDVKVFERAFL